MSYSRIPQTLSLLLICFFLSSCASDLGIGESENCSVHLTEDLATFFDRGDYSFSCMDDHGAFEVMFPQNVNNHRISTQNEQAVEYLVAINYLDTRDKALGNFIFTSTFAETISEIKIEVDGLGAESAYYEVLEEDITQHFIVFRDCNFVGSITAEFLPTDPIPCNAGKDSLVAFAQEILKNI